jgi:hypothetical protein
MVADVFLRSVVRLQNPVLLLEHGLQSTNLHIRVLLWATGIDALLMAIKANDFCDCLVNLLGADTFVFPPDRFFNRQPRYTVGDVVKDLFELRSEIAHGKTIGKKFRESTGLQNVDGRSVASPADKFQYRQVLEECAAFLLCAALRKVLTSNLLTTLATRNDGGFAYSDPSYKMTTDRWLDRAPGQRFDSRRTPSFMNLRNRT